MKFEYWSKRLDNKGGNLYGVGRRTKKTTLRRERLLAKSEIRRETQLNELQSITLKHNI